MAWITPKTNWTSSDYYNFADLNRVENNINELRIYLVSIGYLIPAITVNTTRINTSYDLVSSINRIENNINTIRLAFVTPGDWQSTITWDYTTKFTEAHANRWESSVFNLYTLAQNVYASFTYSGTFASGNQGGLA
jgi:hypothetical protein